MARVIINYEVRGVNRQGSTISRIHGGDFSSKEAAREQRNTMKQAGFTRTYIKKITLT